MKYSELERILKKSGCYDTGEVHAGHPLWINPKTGVKFSVSHHHSQEVASGTLKSILRAAGIK
ncbi:MAG: type II toxin-antitoxin system HicA family toxin [Bacteroidaceae bacterium]|nr:type II toxin-antitoxin system HicA family toxin [Bacteroidaceae bacterium]MBP5647648.1 type II toxin-antitoxin system HicA family toxin [Bacteroidaceae bacterium]